MCISIALHAFTERNEIDTNVSCCCTRFFVTAWTFGLTENYTDDITLKID